MQGTPASSIFPRALRHGAPASKKPHRPPPASNKPHPAEKSTPVWLAIWHTWAGFANSQHRDAVYAASNNICAHFPLLPQRVAAQTDANLSAHLHRLPTPPPCLRRMRLSPGRGAGIRWVMMLAPGRGWSSSKSPSTDAKVNYLVIRYLYFRSVRGGLNLCSPSTSAKVNCLVIRYLHFWSVRGDLLEGSGYASRCQFLLFLCRSTFFPSTKSRFLCAFCLRDPRFRAFRAQNRCICALFAFGPPPF